MMNSETTEFLERRYGENWWPNAKTVWGFATRYGGGMPRRAADLMAFDCLNAGLSEVRRVGEFLGAKPGAHVLDIGCGLGGPGRLLAEERSVSLVGVDISETQVASATALSDALGRGATTRFMRADAVALPFASGRFDGALAIESLVHVEDKLLAISELHRVLRPGARLVIADYIRVGAAPRLDALFPLGYHPWRPGELEKVLTSGGFRVDASEDRSKALADAYASFLRLFSQRHTTPSLIADGLAWWLDGARGLREHLRRAWGFQRFLRERRGAVGRFLGCGRAHILEFCDAQAEACRAGHIRYQLVAAART